MPHATTSPPGTIDAYINYCLPRPAGQQAIVQLETAGARRQKYDVQPVCVTDVRGREHEFRLHVNGFQFVQSFDAPYEAFKDDETIKNEVYEKAADFLKQKTGASHVHVFNHVLRRDPHQKHLDLPDDIPDGAEVKMQTPAVFAHVDQSDEGAKVLINSVEGAASLVPRTSSRWAIINVWHPLKPVTREPLAVCDARSVNDSDFRVTVNRVDTEGAPGKKGMHRLDNYMLQPIYQPEHRWYYKSEMMPGDAVLIKCFDTKRDGTVVRGAPHSAIVTPTDGGPPRESVEIRCVVFWEDQKLEGDEGKFIATGESAWTPL